MQKLTMQHLACYLPYSLQAQIEFPSGILEKGIVKVIGYHPAIGDGDRITVYIDLPHEKGRQIILNKEGKSFFKPLLLPLSELDNEKYESLVSELSLTKNRKGKWSVSFEQGVETWALWAIVKDINVLFQEHFDVFGLIDAELALNKLDYPLK